MLFKVLSIGLLVFFCVIGLEAIQIADKEKVWNMTEATIESTYLNTTKHLQINPENNGFENVITNIVFKIVDTTIYVFFQVTLVAGRIAIENPQIDFELILWLVTMALILAIAVPIIRLLIIAYIFIRDYIDERKYKKKMRYLRTIRNGNH